LRGVAPLIYERRWHSETPVVHSSTKSGVAPLIYERRDTEDRWSPTHLHRKRGPADGVWPTGPSAAWTLLLLLFGRLLLGHRVTSLRRASTDCESRICSAC